MSTEKTAVELQREQIAITNSADLQELDANDTDTNEDSQGEESTTEDANEEVEAAEEQIEASEKTEEELEAEKASAKTQREKDRIQKRINKEVALRKTAEARVAELESQLATKKSDGEVSLSEDDVNTKAQQIADAKLAQKAFDDNCNALADNGSAIKDADDKPLGKKFIEKLNVMAEEVAPIPPAMINILADLDNGAEVLNFMADDIEEYERVLAYPPVKMALELSKISTKLSVPKKIVKAISRVPDPNQPLGAGSRAGSQLNDKMSTEEWITKRNAELAAKRRA